MLLLRDWLPLATTPQQLCGAMSMPALIDRDTREIVGRDGRRRKINARYEFRLLAALAGASGRVLDLDTLARAVYVEEAEQHGPDFLALAYDEPLRKVVARARRLLDAAGYDGRATLENYRAQGYRLHVH